MATIKIYRPNWRRGGESGSLPDMYGTTQLLDSKFQQMCCLGQIAYQLGCPLAFLDGVAEIGHIAEERKSLLDPLVYEDEGELLERGFCVSAMGTNDDQDLSDPEREAELIPLFRGAGIEVEFVDEPAPWFSEVTA